MSAHTPGPHRVLKLHRLTSGLKFSVFSSVGDRVGLFYTEDDAVLFAAAPCLLAALEAVECSGTDCEGTPCCSQCGSGGMHDKGCALGSALTKARGQNDD